MWKSRGGILLNTVPREFQGQKPEGPQAPRWYGSYSNVKWGVTNRWNLLSSVGVGTRRVWYQEGYLKYINIFFKFAEEIA